jgi:antitoxin HigA-1
MVSNMSKMFNPPHPGEVLREALGDISVTEAAEHLGVTRNTLSRLLNGLADVSAEMDVRLSKALGTTLGMWRGMQNDYDMWHAERNFKGKVRRITPKKAA